MRACRAPDLVLNPVCTRRRGPQSPFHRWGAKAGEVSIDPTAPWPHANHRFPGHLRLAPDTLGHPAPRAEAAALVSATLDPPTPHPNLPGREDTPLSTCSGLLRAPCWAPPGRRSRAARGTGARHLVALGGTWWHSPGSDICATDVAHFSPPVDTFHTLRSGGKPRAGER